jgi:hypothetical protein
MHLSGSVYQIIGTAGTVITPLTLHIDTCSSFRMPVNDDFKKLELILATIYSRVLSIHNA